MENGNDHPKPAGAPGQELTELDQELLRETSKECDPELCEKLLSKGAKVNTRDEDGCSPLLWAVLAANLKAVKLLLDRQAEVNCQNHDGETPLHWAALTGKIEIAKLLLAKGAKVNAKDIFGITPLRSASLNGDWDMVKLLRSHGGKEFND